LSAGRAFQKNNRKPGLSYWGGLWIPPFVRISTVQGFPAKVKLVGKAALDLQCSD